MGIMRTKGQGYLVASKNRFSGKVIITSTPIGNNNFYDLYKMKKKLTIQNYDKDLNQAVFYGWDLISADETDDAYLFQLWHRNDTTLRVYITLGRDTQISPTHFVPMHQVYIHDDDGDWDSTQWFLSRNLTYKNFWDVIEDIVDKHHPTQLPF